MGKETRIKAFKKLVEKGKLTEAHNIYKNNGYAEEYEEAKREAGLTEDKSRKKK